MIFLTTPTCRKETNCSPSNEFKKVIGTRDQVKTIAIRNSTNTRSRWTQVTERHVRKEV